MTSVRRLQKAFSVARLNENHPQFSGTQGQIDHWDGELTRSGMKVSPEGALRIAAVWIANTLIADEVSSLVFNLIKRGDLRRVPVKPAELRPLWDRPNPDQVLMDWFATTCLSLTLHGVSYTMTGWLSTGELGVMWPVDPAISTLERMDDQGLRLKVPGQGELENRPGKRPAFMMIPLYRLPGRVEPVSPVKMAAELLGLSLAYERTAARMMGKGLNPSAVMSFGEAIEDDVAEKLSRRLTKLHGGADRAGGVAVVGGPNANLHKLTMSAVDAQMVEQHAAVFALAMALWRVPPTVAGMVDKPSTWGTGVSAFAQGLERFTLRPIVQRLQSHFESYLTSQVDGSLQARFKFDSLLSASPKEKAEIQRLNLMGAMTSQERVLAQNDEPPFGEDETVYSILSMATEEDRALERLKKQAAAFTALRSAGVSVRAAAEMTGFPAELVEEDPTPPAGSLPGAQ